jgi:hypothetical protein
MSVQVRRATVTSSATRLDSTTDPQLRFTVTVVNRGTAAVFVGPSTVTTSDGVQIDVGGSLAVDMRSTDGGLYGVAASGSHTCHVIQVGS